MSTEIVLGIIAAYLTTPDLRQWPVGNMSGEYVQGEDVLHSR